MAFFILVWALCCAACERAHVPSNIQAAPASTATPANRNRPGAKASAPPGPYGAPLVLGSLEDSRVTESSGIVASRLERDIYWTHNDSGDGPFLYAFDRRGKRRGVWRVTGAKNEDWEDISAGPGPLPGQPYLYLGDIGDNNERRAQVIVYRVPEPDATLAPADSTKGDPPATAAAEAIRLRYPDGKHDAETLMVHPLTGDLYIVTKTLLSNPNVYRAAAPLRTAGTTTLERIGTLNIPSLLGGFVTGGDISPDGRRVVICDYLQAYELELPEADRDRFDAIWKQPLKTIALGTRKQGEAICYSLDGGALLATSEGVHSPLIQVARR